MPGRVIDGRALAGRIEADLRHDVAELKRRTGKTPQLDAILVGDDPASALYVKRKEEGAARAQIATKTHRLSPPVDPDELGRMLDALGQDPMINGILLQLPLPPPLDPTGFFPRIHPLKDVDSFHPVNQARVLHGRPLLPPATPQAVLELLAAEQVNLTGADVVIVNHSSLIGKPLAALLLKRDATVTVCNKRTKNLADHTRRADILVTATGVPGLITKDHVRPGATVIDVGIHRGPDGHVHGDVRFEEVMSVAQAVTPVPGGVGPMTIAVLLRNVVEAFRLQHRLGGAV